ncbi:MAG: thiolase family protein [Candidatus Binatus sp.]|uniref:thiolase family protein n=1 Tax=Candidatus Binatus sp. TaxID=2811406 RepID=UPI0027278599|nr:thiolase family protein [Candidatus Binatus sp.]MDO8433167.1 thiolase family protein [Candidatus Binatus sp.]
MRNVYVLGTGMIKFGRYPEKTVPELGGAAVLLALKDAGVTIKDVEMFACGNLYQSNAMVGQRILQQIGQTGIPVINVSNACATGSTAFREAYMSIAAGMYDIAMAVGVEQMGKQGLLGGTGGGDPAYSTEGKVGSSLMPAVFGQAGVEHMRKYGTKMEHFAKISVKSHKHATKNPYSQYRNEVSLEDVMNARMVGYPNTLYMCCPTGDGAAAAILVSEDKLKQLAGGRKRAKVAASILTSDPWTDRDLTLPDVNTLTQRASKLAYETAGLGPKDIALTELHDCFATAELLHYENLGLCGEGEAGAFIDSGGGVHPDLGGKAPVNVSGGLLSKGHPLGATGVANICEVVWHITQDDRAKERLVPNAKAGQAHVIGLGSACTIHILTV